MFEGLDDVYILDTLIYWLDEIVEEDVFDGEIMHPKAAVDEAVTALKALRDRAPSVTMCEEAAWEIQFYEVPLCIFTIDKLEAAQAVYERAIDLLPANSCLHGIEGHGVERADNAESGTS